MFITEDLMKNARNLFAKILVSVLFFLLTVGCTKKAADSLASVVASGKISISSASVSAVNQSSAAVNYQVTYSEVSAATLKISDIILQPTGTASCVKAISNVTDVSATVSLSHCTGDGAIRFQVAAGSATNLLGLLIGASSMSATVTVDNTGITSANYNVRPGLYSVIPSSIDVNFPENINTSSVSASDFSIAGSCAGVSIGSVTVTSSSATVNFSGEGNCQLGETVIVTVNHAGILDVLGNSGSGSTAGTYTITNVGPTSGIFVPATAAVSQNLTSFTLTPSGFIDESTVGIDDFVINGTCVGVAVTGYSISDSEITAQLSGVSNCVNGQTIIITTDLSGINDVSGNIGSGVVVATYTVDTVAPTFNFSIPSSSVAVIPSMVDVVFSADTDMSTVDISNFSLSGTCSSIGISSVVKLLNVATVQFSGANGCADAETVQLDMNISSIVDAVGNPAVGSNSVIYTLDQLGPQGKFSLSSSHVNVMPSSVQIRFEADTNMNTVTAADFSFSGTCGVSLASFGKSGANVILNLSGQGSCTNGQTVIITENLAGTADILGNVGVGSNSLILTMDTIGPVGVFSLSSSVVSSIPSSVDFILSADTDMDAVIDSNFSVTGTCGATINNISILGNTVTVNLNGTSVCANTETVVVHANAAAFLDLSGNAGSGTVSVSFTVDNVGPIASFNVVSARLNPLPSFVTVTFSADTDMNTVGVEDFTVSGSCSAVLDSILVSGQVVTLNLDGVDVCLQDETVDISVNPAGVSDLIGNPGLNNPELISLTFDYIGPIATADISGGLIDILPNSIKIEFDADTNMNTVTAADFNIAGTCAVSISSISKNNSTATLNLSGTNSCLIGTAFILTTTLTGVQDNSGNSGLGSLIETYIQQ